MGVPAMPQLICFVDSSGHPCPAVTSMVGNPCLTTPSHVNLTVLGGPGGIRQEINVPHDPAGTPRTWHEAGE